MNDELPKIPFTTAENEQKDLVFEDENACNATLRKRIKETKDSINNLLK